MKCHYVRACEALEANPKLLMREVAEEIGIPVNRVSQVFWRNGVKFAQVRAEIARKVAA